MIVNSRRFGVTLQQLNEDYHVLCDEPVPYNEFGCASLCTFLKYWPEKFRVIEKLLDIPILVPIDPAVLYFFPKFMFQTVKFPVFRLGNIIPHRLVESSRMAGSKACIVIYDIHNPHRFWFQFKDQSDKLRDLEKKMTLCCAQTQRFSSIVPLNDIKTGLLVSVAINQVVYRAQVLNTQIDSVELRLIDYGTRVHVAPHCVMFLSKMFGELPRQAMRGSLSGVFPIDGKWSIAITKEFITLALGETLWSKIIHVDRMNRICYFTVIINRQRPPIIINLALSELQGYPTPEQQTNIDLIWTSCRHDIANLDPNFIDLENGSEPSFRDSILPKGTITAIELKGFETPDASFITKFYSNTLQKRTKQQKFDAINKPYESLKNYKIKKREDLLRKMLCI